MKVIHLISGGDTGGAKTHIHYLLSGLCKNIDATLVCFMRGEFSDEAEALGIPTVVLDGRNIFKTLRTLKSMIKSGGYDLIHSHGARGNFMASLLRRSCKLPLVATVHSDYKLDYLGRPLANLIYGTLNAYALRRTSYLVGVSAAMKNLLISRGFAPNDIFTIYNGVDFSVVPKNEDRLAYLRSLGLSSVDESSVVVGIAARLDPVKDISTLIRGFAAAEKSAPCLRLVIAGDGAELESLRALALELGVAEKICFAGWISDINTFYAALDINTLTSVSETFPYALTEGARAMLPTISSRVGGVPALITDSETGFLFPAGDHTALGAKLAELAKNPELRKKLGMAIYEKTKREFSVEATTQRQLDIYAEVLRRNKIKKSGGRDGTVICGAYGMGNSGDDAILEAIVGEMRRIDPFMQITALSRNPDETRLRYGINSDYMFHFAAFKRIVRHTRLYLSGGGSLIQNVTSRRSLWYYLYTISSAKKHGNAVMMYGCGIGPVVDRRDEARVAKVLNRSVDVITLREAFSAAELERFGVTRPKIVVSSDPALTLPCASEDEIDAKFAEHKLDPQGTYVCFSLRDWTNFSQNVPIFAAAADFVSEKLGATPIFLLVNRREDGAACEAVCAAMKTKSVIISEPMSSSLTIGVFSRMRAVVSMRLHGLIFAASQGVPLVGISYDPKVTAFLSSVDDELCIQYNNLAAAPLCTMIEKAVLSFDNKEKRQEIVNKLITAEALNNEYARQLLLP
ncbi:MAG: polysaccharide pyruvyl transferase CsaB [Oscillospiraceae bacterium]